MRHDGTNPGLRSGNEPSHMLEPSQSASKSPNATLEVDSLAGPDHDHFGRFYLDDEAPPLPRRVSQLGELSVDLNVDHAVVQLAG